MKKSFFVFLFITLSVLSFAQEIPVSSFAKSKIVIDGNPGEWNLPLKHYDNATRLFLILRTMLTIFIYVFKPKMK